MTDTEELIKETFIGYVALRCIQRRLQRLGVKNWIERDMNHDGRAVGSSEILRGGCRGRLFISGYRDKPLTVAGVQA